MSADIHVEEMIDILSLLEPLPPITKALDAWGTVARDQKGHMIGWLAAQNSQGFGAYTRSKGNESARTAYNRFLNPGGLLWIAEVCGETKANLQKAVEAAKEAERINYRSRCAAFRKIIPFARIMELLRQPERWVYDKRILPLLRFDPETGQPYIKEECERLYIRILSPYFA